MIIIMENGPHYAKEVDDKTGKFIKWISDPNKKSYKEECIEWLEKAESMNNNFLIQSFRKQFDKKGNLSPKQLDLCKKIYEEGGVDEKFY